MNKATRRSLRSRLTVAAVALAAIAAGCATTQQVKISDQNYCPFLGSTVCAQLTPTASAGGKTEADLRYINPIGRV